MSNEIAAPAAPSAPATPSVPTDVNQLAQAIDNKNAVKTAPLVESPKEVAKQRIKQLQLKVHGETISEQLPFEIDDNPEAVEYLTKQLQMSKAAQRAMQESGNYKNQIQNIVQNIQGNTAETLRQLNIDPVQFAAQVLEQEIEKQKLSPEARKNLELEQKLKQLEEDSKRKEKEFQQKEFEAHRKETSTRVENEMIQALDKAADIPHTPYVADRMAKYMLLALNNVDENGQPAPIRLSPEDVIPLVREDILKDMQQLLKGMPEDKLENFIGKDVFTKVRKKNLEKVKTQSAAPIAKVPAKDPNQRPASSPKQKEQPKIAAKDFFKLL